MITLASGGPPPAPASSERPAARASRRAGRPAPSGAVARFFPPPPAAAAGVSKVAIMSREIQRLQTGARMSQVVIANGIVPLAGQVPDSAGAPLAVQAAEVLARIDALLAAAGVDKPRLVTANVWLSDAAHFDAFNAVRDAWVPAGHAPTRACVQSRPMKPGLDVEIAVTALA
jgi:enamine deaminase RidA (YjgF/YER057c/UK114 family)